MTFSNQHKTAYCHPERTTGTRLRVMQGSGLAPGSKILATSRLRGIPVPLRMTMLLLCLSLCAADAPTTTPAALKEMVGKPFRISGTTVDGKALNTESYTERVVIIDFWATWCGP